MLKLWKLYFGKPVHGRTSIEEYPASYGSESQEHESSGDLLADVRERFEKFVLENPDESLYDCREALRDIINEAVGVAWHAGGEQMKRGLEELNGIRFS